jgi:shikimate dehydrogenase
MTRIFGIVGDPIDHSLSPVMHAAAFRTLGLDAIYAPFAVPPRALRPSLEALLACGVAGLNVTVPHKESVLRLLRQGGRVDAQARSIGAVNTLVPREGRWVGYNTDAIGVRATLKQELCLSAKGKTILIVGAGGAARAAGWALLGCRPKAIWVMNRTAAKARRLAEWLRRPGIVTTGWRLSRRQAAEAVPQADLIVQATSLGLHAGDPLPLDPRLLRRGQAVLDLVYRAPTTPLVAAARRRGALAVDGVPMLVYQGAASFRLWWRQEPPIEAMRRAVMQAIRHRH